jgi:hypothetical protein
VVCWAFAAGNAIAPRSKLSDNIVEAFFIAWLSFFASKRKMSRFSSQEPGQSTHDGGPRKTVHHINEVTKIGAIGGNSDRLNLSEISENLRNFGGHIEFCYM